MVKSTVAILAVCGLGIALFLHDPYNYLYLTLIGGHLVWAAFLVAGRFTGSMKGYHVPDILFGTTLVLFLFSYIFATNANMDYVQRFAEGSGVLRLAPDSLTERRGSLLRFGPLLAVDLGVMFYRRVFPVERKIEDLIRYFSLPLTLLSSILYVAALPSFVSLSGLGFLGYICLVPLFLVLKYSPGWWAVLYGMIFGVIQTMLANFWLGTFSLISLQFVTIVYLVLYGLFMIVATAFLKRFRRYGILILPLVWVLFDYLRSLGFTGYPWAMLGVSQYKNIPLMQLSSLTGVWGVSLIVLAANAAIGFCMTEYTRNNRRVRSPSFLVPATFGLLYIILILGGWASMALESRRVRNLDSFTVALVQQNTDPRKDDYREGLTVLKQLTDEAMKSDPELVVWSETAFVPNIRRWSTMDPKRYYYARLVNEFLDYQRGLSTWLLTGNDDYELIPVEGKDAERMDYNAAVLFDAEGRRVDTYRKIHLVPFTEYFPFKESLPQLYELLKNFDVYLWEPGDRRVVFAHPLFTFSTPICFEDGFPNDVRLFVKAGADIIINISNDYWSLSKVEAQQHFANSIFRSVENRRHFLRASASGVTCSIDTTGRLIDKLPMYEEGFLTVEVSAGEGRITPYTFLGDWLPISLGAILVLAYFYSFRRKR